jgi:tRNA-binding protein
VVNFPPKQIANFMSECLLLGVVENTGAVTLATVDTPTMNGLRLL